MTILLAVLVLVFLVVLAVGALTGRVRGGSCCAAADPRRDLRMRDAFTDEWAETQRTGIEGPSARAGGPMGQRPAG
jgi:hypothetical protein